ncbi:hypothetical protein O7632_10100 [Solwaraspora sp. WMMD406]|nr:hypothetical protein [Solwaraspora sp. WMMD406]MDG4764453.1 hypothetical protein [Solwaraspora sp. WMMD406]
MDGRTVANQADLDPLGVDSDSLGAERAARQVQRVVADAVAVV